MRSLLARASVLLASIALAAPALAGPASRGSDVPEALHRLEAGGSVPVAHRPLPSVAKLRARTLGAEPAAAAPAYVEPSEFSVIFEYDGMRSDLERAGIRVQSQAGRFWTARVRRDEIANLRAASGLSNVRLARYVEKHLNVSRPEVRADLEQNPTGTPPWYRGRAGKGVLIGDVDSGIDYTSPDFSDSLGKTRILYIWDQNDLVGPHPTGFTYGSEWTKSQIDNTPGTVRHQDTDGHGTNVAGVLAGSGKATGCGQPAYRFVGVAPQANFVEVATNFSDAGIIDGVNYIFQKASALGMDAVVNLSLGSNFGPHDGSDSFSSAISALTGPGRIVVASSGNAQADNIHGKLTTTSTTVGTDRFLVTVPTYTANAGTFNDYFLITGWYDATASMTIRVKGPNVGDTLSVGFGNTKDRDLTATGGKGGRIFVANNNVFYALNGTATARQFEVEVYDTLSTSAPRNGTWEIDVVPNGAGNIGKRVDIWCYASLLGSPSLFLEATVSATGNRDLTTMVGEPADGDSVIAVGSYSTKASWTSCTSTSCGYTSPPALNAISYFSCVGPRRDGVLKPEITAPGFGVATTHSSFLGAIGACDADDGQHEITQGTSFSAPHVSGAAALYLQYWPHSSPSRIKLALEANARSDVFTGSVPNTTWGYGKLDVYGSIDHVNPSCAVTSPVGGEAWGQGSPQTVTWNATDNVGVTSVNVDYSLHGAGGPWVNIATAIPNSGSTGWTLPSTTSDSALVRVTASDQGGNSATAQSAALFSITASTGVPPTPVAAALWLAPPVPNPSTGSVDLRFSLARTGRAALEVYGVRGERVWSQAWDGLAPGEHLATWNGLNASGHRAGSGLFFVRLTTDTGVRRTRLVRLD